MRVGFVQFNPVFGEKKLNIKRSVTLIGRMNADLLVLPELCNTGYLFISKDEVEDLAEEIPNGPTIRAWQNIAESKEVYLVAGMAEAADGKFYNSAVLISPEGEVKVYRKAHLFDDEKRWFQPGDTPFEVHDIGMAKIGMMICFDWIFPEVMRILSLKGAEIICHPANLVLPYCQDAMVTRCIENQVFAITCNRTGIDEVDNAMLRFTGKSQVVTPDGSVLTRAGEIGEAARVLEIDPAKALDKSITKRNNIFEDRRTDLFSDLVKTPVALPATLPSGQVERKSD